MLYIKEINYSGRSLIFSKRKPDTGGVCDLRKKPDSQRVKVQKFTEYESHKETAAKVTWLI